MSNKLKAWTPEMLLNHYAGCVRRLQDDHNFEMDAREACISRSALESARVALTQQQLAQLGAIDDQLQAHYARVVEAEVFANGHPRTHWWWHLGEGPQVRDEAQALLAS